MGGDGGKGGYANGSGKGKGKGDNGGKGKGGKGGGKGGGWQEDGPDTALSKKMSDILRHRAEWFGLAMLPDGFVKVVDMLQIQDHQGQWFEGCACWPFFPGFTIEDVVRVARANDKQRFRLWEDERGELFVRANQGHTLRGVDDESLLVEVADAAELRRNGEVPTHGTYWSYYGQPVWETIKVEGMKPMGRNHMHFAPRPPSAETEVLSGMRTTCEVMIYLDVDKAFAAGMKLWRSANGVLLTRGLNGVVAPEFFRQVVQRRPYRILWPEGVQAPLGERRIPGCDPSAENTTQRNGPKAKGVSAKPKAKAAAGPMVLAAEVAESWEQVEVDNVTQPNESAPAEQANDAADTTVLEVVEVDPEQLRLKELRGVEKKLKQIQALQEKKARGDELDEAALEKIAGKLALEGQAKLLAKEVGNGSALPKKRWDKATSQKAVAVAKLEPTVAAKVEPTAKVVPARPAKVEPIVAAKVEPSAAKVEPNKDKDKEKELRSIEKKLRQIQDSEAKQKEGATLDAAVLEKIANKKDLEKQAAKLRASLK